MAVPSVALRVVVLGEEEFTVAVVVEGNDSFSLALSSVDKGAV